MNKKVIYLLPLIILIIPIVYHHCSIPSLIDESKPLYALHHNHFEDPVTHTTIDYPNIVSDDIGLQDTINFEILNQITNIQATHPSYKQITYQITSQDESLFDIAFTVDHMPFTRLSFDILQLRDENPEKIDS